MYLKNYRIHENNNKQLIYTIGLTAVAHGRQIPIQSVDKRFCFVGNAEKPGRTPNHTANGEAKTGKVLILKALVIRMKTLASFYTAADKLSWCFVHRILHFVYVYTH